MRLSFVRSRKRDGHQRQIVTEILHRVQHRQCIISENFRRIRVGVGLDFDQCVQHPCADADPLHRLFELSEREGIQILSLSAEIANSIFAGDAFQCANPLDRCQYAFLCAIEHLLSVDLGCSSEQPRIRILHLFG